MMCPWLQVQHKDSELCGVPPFTLIVTITFLSLRSAAALRDALIMPVGICADTKSRVRAQRKTMCSRDSAAHVAALCRKFKDFAVEKTRLAKESKRRRFAAAILSLRQRRKTA